MSRKVIFLDRDGVINRERGEYTYRVEDFEFNEGLFDALRTLRDARYEFIMVTNQGGIAKGLYSHSDFEKVTMYMIEQLKNGGIELLEWYYSPHHQDFGASLDRKPDSIMIEKALARFGIDAKRSYIIGDSDRDIAAGEKAGIRGIKVDPNADLRPVVKAIVEHE